MITIKIGGSVVDNLHPSFMSDLKRISGDGLILVHGGGKEVTRVSSQLGREPRVRHVAQRNQEPVHRPGDRGDIYHGDVGAASTRA